MASVTAMPDSRPFLSYEPINFSLTEGTSIPAPPPSPPQKPQQTAHTIRRKEVRQMSNGRIPPSSPDSASSLQNDIPIGGPLSSHPISPVNSHTFARPDAPEARQNGTAYRSMDGSSYRHVSGESSDSNNFDPALPPHQPSTDSSRRPSFVSRIMRLRSSSFMRSKSSLGKYDDSANPSVTSLSATTNGSKKQNGRSHPDGERGVKRPGTPSGANTFPRMVRKKSMDLFGSARRKSGLWGRGDDSGGNTYQSAVDDEKAQERAREEYLASFEHDRSQLHRQATQNSMLLRSGSPPPEVQLRLGGDALSGEDMFGNIGK